MKAADERIRAVLDAPTEEERRAALDRLTDADWERIAKEVQITPADLEAAAEEEPIELPGIPRGPVIDSAEAAAAESLRREREPDPDR